MKLTLLFLLTFINANLHSFFGNKTISYEEWKQEQTLTWEQKYNMLVANLLDDSICNFITEDFKSKIQFSEELGKGGQGTVYDYDSSSVVKSLPPYERVSEMRSLDFIHKHLRVTAGDP